MLSLNLTYKFTIPAEPTGDILQGVIGISWLGALVTGPLAISEAKKKKKFLPLIYITYLCLIVFTIYSLIWAYMAFTNPNNW